MTASARRLATLRILIGAFAVGYLLVRLPVFLDLADGAPARFEPVGVLSLLDEPLPSGAWVAIVWITLALGVAYTAGALFRLTGPAFAIALLAVTTYHSSWGQLLWFENLFVLHVAVVGCSRAADALSVDARGAPVDESSVAYGFPIRLAALVTVTTYVLAGIAKLRLGGTEWMTGDTLRNHIAYSAARLDLLGGTPSPLAEPLVSQGWLLTPLAIASVVIELGAPVALASGWLRTAWVAGAWVMHAAIAASMFVVFPYPLFLVAFVPFFDIQWRTRSARRVGT